MRSERRIRKSENLKKIEDECELKEKWRRRSCRSSKQMSA